MILAFLILAQPPTFEPPFLVKVDGKPIDVSIGHAAPLLADIDGTGKPKLLVGQFQHGNIRVFGNSGGGKWSPLGFLKAGEADLAVSYG